MEQRVHIMTLGVADLAKAAAFYDALGWSRVPDAPSELVAYDLHGAVLGLYPRAALADDIGVELPAGSGAMTLSHNTRTKEEVAEILSAAEAAGAEILRPATDAFWGGHNGYFRDPDGHIWEVAFNPFTPLGPKGEFQWGGVS